MKYFIQLLIFTCFSIFHQTTYAAEANVKQALLKFHQSLYQHCKEVNIECTAFSNQKPEKLVADQSEWLKRMKPINHSDQKNEQQKILTENQKSALIQKKVLQEVPEATHAYEVLGMEYQQELPKTHDEAVQWIMKNSAQLEQGLKASNNYNSEQAYSFAKLGIMMHFIYQALNDGKFNQSDLDAKYEFEKAGYHIAQLLKPSFKSTRSNHQ